MPDASWPLWANVVAFLAAAGTILFAGSKLARGADRIADQTGLGEAITGVIFLGFVTALPGIAASVTAAVDELASMSVSNAMGGIAAQTMFLAIADMVYRRANLEHAAASIANLVQTGVLVGLMTLVIAAMAGPDWQIWHVHVATPLLLVVGGLGLWLIRSADDAPMWQPRETLETIHDEPDPENQRRDLARLLAAFSFFAVLVLIAGTVAARAAGALIVETGTSESLMGGLFLAFATSLPELVTTIAAIRIGALTLAVSDIVGGNVFDALFVCFADIAYTGGSIYHAAGPSEVFITALAIVLNVLLLLGLLARQERGLGNIGFESVLILMVYLGGMAIVAFAF